MRSEKQRLTSMRRITAHILSILMIISTIGAGYAALGGIVADEAYATEGTSSFLVLRSRPTPLERDEFNLPWGEDFNYYTYDKTTIWEGSKAQRWCVNYYNNQLADYKEYIDGVKTTEGSAYYAEPELKDYLGCDIDGTQGDKDKVFFLSAREYIKYKDYVPTYENDMGLDSDGGREARKWWLRSPYRGYNYAAAVSFSGKLTFWDGFSSLAISYRPAFYLNESFFTWCRYDEYEDTYYWSNKRVTNLWYKSGFGGMPTIFDAVNQGKVNRVYMYHGNDLESFTVLGEYTDNSRPASEVLTEGDHLYLGSGSDTYAGVPYWRVIGLRDEDGDNTNDHALLMSEFLWAGNGTDSKAGVAFDSDSEADPDKAAAQDWNSTLAEQWCDGFYKSIFSDKDKAVIAGRDVSSDTVPDAYGLTADNKVFFLSKQELKEYLDTDIEIDDGRDESLVSYEQAMTGASWWLRNVDGEGNVLAVSSEGALNWTKSSAECLTRPALYLDLTSLRLLTGGVDEKGNIDFAPSWYGSVSGSYEENQGEKTDPQKEDPKPENTASKVEIKDGTVLKSNGTQVKVISVKDGTAAYIKAPNRKSVTVPASVNVGDKTLKIVSIEAGAFKKSKAATVTVKTKELTKASVKNSLKGSKVKTIRVKVGSAKVNKKYVKKYKKIFTKKNSGRKVKVS